MSDLDSVQRSISKNNKYNTATLQRALVNLGTLLHPLQDILAHTDKVSKFQKIVPTKNQSVKKFSYYNGSYGYWYHSTDKSIDSAQAHKRVVVEDVKLTTCLIFVLLIYKYPFLKG